MNYHRTQTGKLLLTVLLAVAIPTLVGSFIVIMTVEEDPLFGGAVVLTSLAVTLGVAWIFRSMTIRVDADRLEWYFGSGIFRRSRALREIQHVERRRVSPFWGLGIHLTPHGWLYNVSGFDVVQVRLRSGQRFLLGTDEPEALVRAIEAARAATPSPP